MKKKESSEKECRNYYTEINREGLLCVGVNVLYYNVHTSYSDIMPRMDNTFVVIKWDVMWR